MEFNQKRETFHLAIALCDSFLESTINVKQQEL